MIRLIIALSFVALSGAEAFAVIGGFPAPELARHTLMVLSKKGSVCSGVVIGKYSVLTAAHCVDDNSEYTLYFRTQTDEAVLIAPQTIRRHPGYVSDAIKKRTKSIDLAIIQLKDPLPAQFQPVGFSRDNPSAGEQLILGGYGLSDEKNRSSNGKLLSTSLDVVEPYGKSKILLWLKGASLDQSNLSRGGCHETSGGPVMKGDKLVAITSWTTGPKDLDCGELTQGILVAPQQDWINKNLK